jgi:streptogramin lyase
VGVSVGSGSVWVANEFDGTVSRIDPMRSEVVQSIETGNRPQGVEAAAGQIWIAVRAATARRRGGTLRIAASMTSLDAIDPAVGNLLSPALLLNVTNDGLVTLKHVAGSTGTSSCPISR